MVAHGRKCSDFVTIWIVGGSIAYYGRGLVILDLGVFPGFSTLPMTLWTTWHCSINSFLLKLEWFLFQLPESNDTNHKVNISNYNFLKTILYIFQTKNWRQIHHRLSDTYGIKFKLSLIHKFFHDLASTYFSKLISYILSQVSLGASHTELMDFPKYNVPFLCLGHVGLSICDYFLTHWFIYSPNVYWPTTICQSLC